MSSAGKKIVGWGLIAAIAAICFGLNELRAQYIYFNWFVIFTLIASAILVVTLLLLEHRAGNDETDLPGNAD